MLNKRIPTLYYFSEGLFYKYSRYSKFLKLYNRGEYIQDVILCNYYVAFAHPPLINNIDGF